MLLNFQPGLHFGNLNAFWETYVYLVKRIIVKVIEYLCNQSIKGFVFRFKTRLKNCIPEKMDYEASSHSNNMLHTGM